MKAHPALPHCRFLYIALLAMNVQTPAPAQTPATWLGSNVNGNWSDPSRWSTNPIVPNGNFDVTHTTGTITLDTNVSLNSLTMSGGNAGAGFNMDINTFSWSQGSLSGNGIVTVNTALNLTVADNPVVLTDRVLNTNGTTAWTTTAFTFNNNGTINNGGTWNVTGGQGMGAAGVFNNNGIFNKSGGGTTPISAIFNNNNQVNISNGTTLALSGTGAQAGDFNIGAGSTLRFGGSNNSHTLEAGATFSGSSAGIVAIAPGTVTASTPVSIGQILELSGSLNGPGTVTSSGGMTWSNGSIAGTNAVTDIVNVTGALSISGASGKTLTSRTLNTSGATTWDTNGFGFSTHSSVINNTGTWEVTGSQGMGSGGSFNNSGSFTKSGGATTTMSLAFNNQSGGSVHVINGTTLQFTTSGGAHAGAFNLGSGSTLQISDGSHALDSGASFTGAGTLHISGGTLTANTAMAIPTAVLLDGGTLNGAGAVTLNGPVTWTSFGSMTGTNAATDITTINGDLTIAGGAQTKNLTTRTLNTTGNVLWTSGAGSLLNVSTGAVINNTGTWDITGSGSLGAPAGGTFNNSANFNKTSGGTNNISPNFNNTGTVNVSSGAGTGITMIGTVTQHVGTTLTGGSWNISNGSALTFNTGSNITTNQGSVILDGAGSSFNRLTTALNNNQGSLTLKNDRDLTTAGAYTNSGTTRVEDSTTVMTIGTGGSAAYTQIAGETVLVGGAIIDASVFNLNGGELRGNGTIVCSVVTGGTNTIAPGLSPGVLTIDGDLTLSTGSALSMEIDGLTQGTLYDYLDVNGIATLAGILELDLDNIFDDTLVGTEIFTLLTANSAILGSFSNVASGSRLTVGNQGSFAIHYGAGSAFGSSNVVATDFIVVPEPSRAILLMLGLASTLLRRKRNGHAALKEA